MTQGHMRRQGEGSWEINFDLDRDPLTGRRITKYVTSTRSVNIGRSLATQMNLCLTSMRRTTAVCRMHGARGGAPTGKRNGNYKHGARTKKAINAGRKVNALLRHIRKCG